MKKMLLVTTGLLLATPALADQHMAADTDGDGMISFEELSAANPDVTQEAFDSADSDGDGMLNDEEMTAAAEAGTIPASEG